MSEKLGITVKKDENFSEWYSQLVQKAELADIRFGIQGFIVHRPWGYMVIRKIYDFLEEEVERQGHLPFRFPVAVKEESLAKEKDHAGFTPEVFWVSEAGNKKIEERFALRPTGEAQIYPMYSLWFRSHNDLPFLGYQSRMSVFRNEMTTRPFLRGREFLFFETHNAYYKHEEALEQIGLDIETCDKVIYEKAKIPFHYFKRPAWDKFAGADDTFTPDTLMPDGKRNQLASTHDLGQNFSKAFDIKVLGDDEKKHFVWQTCFGPGIWRIMAAIIGIHGDDNGLVLPFEFAPVQVVIIPITFSKEKSENEKVLRKARELEEKIRKLGFKAKVDDSDNTPGWKYNKWDLFGAPLRIEIGPREVKNKKLTFSLRTRKEKYEAKEADLKKEINKHAKNLNSDIKKKADKYFEGNTREAKTFEEVKSMIDKHRGFIKAPFCSVDRKGEKCADELKAETEGGAVCGTLYPKEEKPPKDSKCVVCGKKAGHMVYIAKSY